MTMGTNLKVWLVGLVLLSAAVSPALVCGDTITPSQYWKNQIGFPDDPFCSETGSGGIQGYLRTDYEQSNEVDSDGAGHRRSAGRLGRVVGESECEDQYEQDEHRCAVETGGNCLQPGDGSRQSNRADGD